MINFKELFEELLDCIENGKMDNKIIFPKPNALRLSDKRLDDEQGEHLVDLLLHNTTFDNICFSNNHLGPVSSLAIARMLIVNKRLTNISLNNNEINDNAGAAIVGALEFNSTLQEIALRYNILGSKAVLALSKMLLVNKTLRNLSFSATFSENAISSIINALSINNTLQHIYLDSDTDQRNDLGLAIAKILKVNKHLKRIDLGGLHRARDENFVNEVTIETGIAIVKALEFNKSVTCLSINLWRYTSDSKKRSIIETKARLLARNEEIQNIEEEIKDLVLSEILASLKAKTSEPKEAAEKFDFKRHAIFDRIKKLASSDIAEEFPHTKVFARELEDKLMTISGGHLPSPTVRKIGPLCFSKASPGDSKSQAEAESFSSGDDKIPPTSKAVFMDCSSDNPEDLSKKRKDHPTDSDKLERDPKRLKSSQTA